MAVPNHSQDSLPSYTARTSSSLRQNIARAADRSEHTCSLENSKGHSWVSLTVNSRSQHPKSPPTYFERDLIDGRVDFDLEKSESIKAVIISVSELRINCACCPVHTPIGRRWHDVGGARGAALPRHQTNTLDPSASGWCERPINCETQRQILLAFFDHIAQRSYRSRSWAISYAAYVHGES